MGIFDWLFKKRNVDKPEMGAVRTRSQMVELEKPFLHVSTMDYGGLYSLSKSKKWAISWRDSDPAVGRGGQRESGHGEYVLADLAGDL